MKTREELIGMRFEDAYEYCIDQTNLNWDNVNTLETLNEYIKEKADEGIKVSHILRAVEENRSEYEIYDIWLGDSMNTPAPIDSVKDLLDALAYSTDKDDE